MSDFLANKLREIAIASEAKKTELNEVSLDKIGQFAPSTGRAADYKNSVAGRLAEAGVISQDGVLYDTVNQGMDLFSGATRTAGQMIGALPTLKAKAHEMHIPDEVRGAYARKQVGAATPEDEALLALPSGWTKQKTYLSPMEREAVKGNFETNEQRIQSAIGALDTANNIADAADYTKHVDGTKAQQISERIQGDFKGTKENFNKGVENFKDGNYLSGAAGVAGSVVGAAGDILGAGVDNPQAVLGAVLNNAPQLAIAAMGPAGFAASNSAYGVDTFREGVQEQMKANKGQLPSREEINKTALKSAAAAALEGAGDLFSLGAARVFKPLAGVAEEASAAGASALKRAANFPGVGLATNTSKGAAGEFVTEAGQTALEESAKGKEATIEQIFEGGAMGALVGGTMRGGSEILGGGRSAQAKVVDTVASSIAATKDMQEAVANKNPEVFLDKTSDNYNPQKAIQVLQAINSTDISPKEKQQNIERARSIAEDVASESVNFEQAKELRADPAKAETITLMKEMVAEDRAALSAMDPTTPEFKQQERSVNDIQRQIELAEMSDTAFKTAESVAEGHTKNTQEAFTRVARREAVSLDLDAEISTIETAKPGSAEAVSSAKKILNLAMAVPEKVDVAKVEALVSNTKNGLGEADRSYLQKWLDARKATEGLKKLGDVSKQILQGDKNEGFKGLEQYRESITRALNSGNLPAANKQSMELRAFMNKHASKAAAFNEAYAKASSDGLNYYPTRQSDGMWVLNNEKPTTGKAKRDFFDIHRGSGSFVEAVNAESQALTATFNELGAAYRVQKKATNSVAKNALKTTVQPVQDVLATVDTKPSVGTPTAAQAAPVGQATRQPKKTEVESKPQATKPEPSTSPTPKVEPAKQDAKSSEEPKANRADESIAAKAGETPTQDSQAENSSNDIKEETEGGMTVFKNKVLELAKDTLASNYGKVNRIAQFFKQDTKTEGKDTVKPLVSRKDFLTAWNESKDFPSNYLKNQSLTEQQNTALDNLFQTLNSWNKLVSDNYVNKGIKAEFTEDIFQELFNGNQAVTDENITTAISYAAYSWVNDVAYDPTYKTVDEFFDMHGLEATESTMPNYKEMRTIYGHQHTLHQELGKTIVQALGLKATKNAPQDLMPKLESALGARAAALLIDAGAIKAKFVPVNKINESLGLPSNPANDLKKNSYYYINRSKDRALPAVMASIVEANKHSADVVNKVFGADKAALFASTEPTEFNQVFAKKTNQFVPSKLKEVLNKSQNTPITAIPNMIAMFRALGDDLVVTAAGGKKASEVHARDRDSAEAKMDGLYRELDIMNTMLADPNLPDGMETKFYIEHEVWKNFRVGIKTKSLNQQSSKIHRFAFAQPGWEVEIDPSKPDQLNKFLIAFAQNSGLVKTDTQTNEKTLEILKDKVQKPEFIAAVEATQAMLESSKESEVPNITKEQQEAIANFSAANEGMMTLQSLVSYAEYLNAEGKPFKTTMLVGADGKTNGPMLTMLALGVGDFDTLAMGGMYPIGEDQPTHFSQWYSGSANAQDLYQRTAKNALDNVFAGGNPTILNAIQTITGNLIDENGKVTSAGRNIIKTPLTAFFFGSALNKSISSMADKFVDDTYSKIAKIKNEKDSTKQANDTKALIKALNDLVGFKALANTTTIDKLFETSLNDLGINEKTLHDAFTNHVGKPTKESMKHDFASFIDYRKAFSQATNAAYAAYEIAYNDLRNKEFERLISAGEIATRTTKNGEVVPIHDMTEAQEESFRRSIKDMLPIMNTAYSLEDKRLGTGIYMAKSKISPTDNPLYESKATFKNTYPNAGGKDTATMRSSASIRNDAAPGAMGLPGGIHSSDSFAMHHALDTNPNSLNVHDEGSNSILAIDSLASDLNKSVFNTFLEFSPMGEASKMLDRIVIGLAKRIDSGEVSPAAALEIGKAWVKLQNHKPIKITNEMATAELTNFPAVTKDFAAVADRSRLNILRNMGVIDQYTWEGGQYNVTSADRDMAEHAYDAVDFKQNPKAKAAAEFLAKQASGNPEVQLASWIKTMQEENLETEVNDDVTVLETAKDLGIEESIAAPVVTAVAESVPAAGPVAEAMANGQDIATAVEALPVAEKLQLKETIRAVAKAIPKVLYNAWGEFGVPTTQDPFMVQRLEAKPVMNKNEVVKMLYNAIKNQPSNRISGFQMELLKQLNKTIPNDVTVHYITENTTHNGEVVMNNSRGWFTNEGNNIYILGTAYKNSQVTPEVFLHELTHSALADAVQSVLDNPKTANPDAVELVNNLKDLQTKAMEKAKDLGIEAKYAEPLNNIHEFITWGMTNQAFQREVLTQFNTKVKYAGNSLVSGMKAVISAFKEFLFKGSNRTTQAITVNGMTAMITNVSGLLADQANRESNVSLIAKETAKANPDKTKLNLAMSVNDPTASVMVKHVNDVFAHVMANDHATRTEAFNEHLKDLVNNVSTKLMGALGDTYQTAMRNGARTAVDVYAATLQDPNWTTPNAFAVGLPFNETETFAANQVQTLMHEVLSRKDAPASLGVRELRNIYSTVVNKLSPEHFMDVAQGDPMVAAAMHNSITDIQPGSDYLARFATLALTNEAFKNVLNKLERETKQPVEGFFNKVMDMFNNVLDWVTGKITKSNPEDAFDNRINRVVEQLVHNEHKLRNKEIKKALDGETFLEGTLNKANEKIINTATAIGDSPLFQSSGNAFIKLTGNVIGLVSNNDRAAYFVEGMRKTRDSMRKQRDGFLTTLFEEVKGPNQVFESLLRYAKNNERNRMQMQDNIGKALLGGFDPKTEINTQTSTALTNTFLRTDVQSLLGQYNMTEITNLVSDKAFLESEIAKQEAKLPKNAHNAFYVGASKALAYWMATGTVTSGHLLMNAHNISRLGGTTQQGSISESQAVKLDAIIDPLVSLYALRYTAEGQKRQAAQVLKAENARGKAGNGVEFLVRLHQGFVADSRAELFENDEALMTKGYMPEITNPNISVTAANEQDGATLIKQGWVVVGDLHPDSRDPTAEKRRLYARPDGGMGSHETGAFSYSALHSKGSEMSQDNSVLVKTMHGATALNPSNGSMYNTKFDPTKVQKTFAAPVLDGAGNVVNYRYMMNNHMRDTILQRDNRFDKVMGAFAATSMDKLDSVDQNKTMIEAVKKQYDEDVKSIINEDAYIEFGPNSEDPFLKEHYMMLPAQAKQDIKKIWGSNTMMIRADQANLLLGSRMPSAANLFEVPMEQRNAVNKIVTMAIEGILKGFHFIKHRNYDDAKDFATHQAGYRVGQFERGWQEIMKEIKSNIVIKNIEVFAGNVSSNVSLLVLAGVPLTEIVKQHRIAYIAAEDFSRDNSRKIELEAMIDNGYFPDGETKMRRELAQVTQALENNPAKKLMDAGLMPTIVEDIDTSDDIYSYKSQLATKVEGITNMIPEGVRSVAKELYATKDSWYFQKMNRATQLSDFVARYTLIQHAMNRKVNPLNEADAMYYASEAFINYDLPSHRYLNYANAMGLVMFTKYYMRVQRMILFLMKENPARAMMMALSHNYMKGLPILFDSFFPGRIGNNPFTVGVFNYFGSVKNILPIQMLTSPLR